MALVLRGSYQVQANNPLFPASSSYHACVFAYIVERGLILDQYEVDKKTNEIKALPEFIKQMALKGVVFAFDAISTQKKLASFLSRAKTTTSERLRATSPACCQKLRPITSVNNNTHSSTLDTAEWKGAPSVSVVP